MLYHSMIKAFFLLAVKACHPAIKHDVFNYINMLNSELLDMQADMLTSKLTHTQQKKVYNKLDSILQYNQDIVSKLLSMQADKECKNV